MKDSVPSRAFCTLTTTAICNAIVNAQSRVIYAAPGIFRPEAESLTMFWQRNPSGLNVILNLDPEMCRVGYGELGAVENLIEAGIVPVKAIGLRLGVLVIDARAWVFTPTPCVIEEPPKDGTINAIMVSEAEALHLVREIALPAELQAQSAFSQCRAENETKLTTTPVTKEDMGFAREELMKCPPRRFDLARRVSVYQAYIQFVELNLTGVHIQRHTVRLPKDLFGITEKDDIQERLKASFSLIEKDSSISSKAIEDQVARLRKIYLRSLGKRFGVVILRQKKEEFLQEVNEIRNQINEFRKNIRTQLAEDFEKCKATLITTFTPMVIEKPPDRLRAEIASQKPSREQAEKFVRISLEREFPDPTTFIGEMKLNCLFKDVTYEMLNDPEFQTALENQYPLIQWPKPYKEFDAAPQVST